MTDIEFVNDVERLEWAVEALQGAWGSSCGCCCNEDDDNRHADAINVVVKYVPILIKSYEELFKESMNLTAAWEAYIENRTPEGLYLPSTRIEA